MIAWLEVRLFYSLHLPSNALKTIQDSFGISNHSVDAEDNKSEESSGSSSSSPAGSDDTGKWKPSQSLKASEGKNSQNSDGHCCQQSLSQFKGKILMKAIESTPFYRFSQEISMVKVTHPEIFDEQLELFSFYQAIQPTVQYSKSLNTKVN